MTSEPRSRNWFLVAASIVALAAAVALQMLRDRRYAFEAREAERILYVRSGSAVARLALEYDALAADTYWIRALQHYGGERLTQDRKRTYELLYPLLDLTTSLDPYFTIAYRFGAIFLSEAYPGGPGRPDQAIALLQKGITARPGKWQYYHDVAFVYYWHLRDFKAAANWFLRGADQPNAPNWLRPVAASMISAGGDRAAARFLWSQILQSDEAWLRRTAERSLLQLNALDAIDQLTVMVQRFPLTPGEAYGWDRFIRRGVLRAIPLDPSGTPFEIDPVTGKVTLSKSSSLLPLPEPMMRAMS
jgi:tetratricopeptide (TPR) repeat protein